MLYETIEPISHETAEELATSAQAETLVSGILAVALHDDDLAWAEAFCARFAANPTAALAAATAL